ncbi:MAG: nickel-responsive transcriptional regulator NikR [Candidatus Bathyarchaeota archaeon]|nr:MAG: nickel-responsive transcriptional regulator NikR [Candidatus Bathyarchaeota archaeon]
MAEIVRVGITFPRKLLAEFDTLITNMGYTSRSKAIHDTIRTFVNKQTWLAAREGAMVGSITMLYNHEMRELESDLTDAQHHFEAIICASMHVHLSKGKCLETIAVKGEVHEIKRLVEKLKARRGVEEVKLNVFSI